MAEAQAVPTEVRTDAAEAVPAYEYPVDERDGWEPGAPSLKAMGPSGIAGGIIPICLYFVMRHVLGSDAPALAIAGIPAALWVVVEWIRRRRLDPLALIVLISFIGGLSASAALGGSAFVLKVRDSGFTLAFGLACLLSLRIGAKPMMFHLGKALSAGDDRVKMQLFEDLWAIPPARVVFKIVTVAWGVGLIAEALLRVLLAIVLPTGVFVAISPVIAAVFFGGLFAFTVRFTRWSRDQSDEAFAMELPDNGGSMLWWLRYYRGVAVERRAAAVVAAAEVTGV